MSLAPPHCVVRYYFVERGANDSADSLAQSSSELSYKLRQLLRVQIVLTKTEGEVEIPSVAFRQAKSKAEKTFVDKVMGAIQDATLDENKLQNRIFCAIKDLKM
jgi:hypothetical protein